MYVNIQVHPGDVVCCIGVGVTGVGVTGVGVDALGQLATHVEHYPPLLCSELGTLNWVE